MVNSKARESQGAVPKTKPALQYQHKADSKETNIPSQLADRELNLNLLTMMREDTGSSECSKWILYPPEPNNTGENTILKDASEAESIPVDSAVQDISQESGFFSEEGSSFIQSSSPTNTPMLSPVPGIESKESQYQNDAPSHVPDVEKTKDSASSLSNDSDQQSDKLETSSRPTTPQGAQNLCNPLPFVTGRHSDRQHQNNCIVMAPPENSDETNSGQEHGEPGEHYDTSENNGLLEQLQQVNNSKAHLYAINFSGNCSYKLLDTDCRLVTNNDNNLLFIIYFII